MPSKTVRHHPDVTFAEVTELLGKVKRTTLNALTRWAIRLLGLERKSAFYGGDFTALVDVRD